MACACAGLSWASTLNSYHREPSGPFVRQKLRVTAARSASRVRKLCSGDPSAVWRVALLCRALAEGSAGATGLPVFQNQRGGALSHDGLAYLLAKHLAVPRQACPSPQGKRVTPHVLLQYSELGILKSIL